MLTSVNTCTTKIVTTEIRGYIYFFVVSLFQISIRLILVTYRISLLLTQYSTTHHTTPQHTTTPHTTHKVRKKENEREKNSDYTYSTYCFIS
mmetsp:Transcript_35841/g.36298  ORF Transcript_35841/g.36298 Transcript_35841/m.36298 type:complete len:92 (-) Transcript_35841:131-406(-)